MRRERSAHSCPAHIATLTAFRPVVTRSALAENEVVGAEEAAKGAGAHGVHGTRLQVNQDRARNVLVRPNFVVVHVDPLKLLIVGTLVLPIRVDTVLI